MSDIELVTRIPEEVYNYTKDNYQFADVQDMSFVISAVANGTLLPKSHGRLLVISEDYVKEHMIGLDAFQQKFIGEVDLSMAIVGTIEAYKENGE